MPSLFRTLLSAVALTILGMCVTAAVLAQGSGAATETLPIAVSVTLTNGQPVDDLAQADFAVLEDGQPVPVTSFSATPKSLALVVLVSDQERMVKHRPRARVVGETIVGLLEPDDRVAITGLESWRGGFRAGHELPQLSADLNQAMSRPATSDRSTGSRSWISMSGAGRALRKLPTAEFVQAIIALSSGLDFATSDEHELYNQLNEFGSPADENARRREDAAMTTAGEGVVVFGFGFNGTGDDKHLQRLTGDSGGQFFDANRSIDLRRSVERVIRDLRARYLLRFLPQSMDGRRHALEVVVRRPNLVVRARSFHSGHVVVR